MSTNPILDVLKLLIQDNERQRAGSGMGVPNTASTDASVTGIDERWTPDDPMANAKAQIRLQLLQRELEDSKFTGPPSKRHGLSPDMLRYLQDLPQDPNPMPRYLEPDDPDVPNPWQRDYMPISQYQPGLLTRLTAATSIPYQSQIDKGIPHTNPYRDNYAPQPNKTPEQTYESPYNPYHPNYRRGTIQEAKPPDWLDPAMELLLERKPWSPPDARDLRAKPSDPSEDPLYDEDIDPQEERS